MLFKEIVFEKKNVWKITEPKMRPPFWRIALARRHGGHNCKQVVKQILPDNINNFHGGTLPILGSLSKTFLRGGRQTVRQMFSSLGCIIDFR